MNSLNIFGLRARDGFPELLVLKSGFDNTANVNHVEIARTQFMKARSTGLIFYGIVVIPEGSDDGAVYTF